MSKTVCITFDDGLHDQYEYAFNALKKYGLSGVFYITTSTIGLENQSVFLYKTINQDELTEIHSNKMMEIGAHGVKHKNTIDEINQSVDCLKKMLNINKNIGFASPESEICDINFPNKDLLKNVSYIRTSVKVRRNGFFYSCMYAANILIKSKRLFYELNKKYLMKPNAFKGKVPLLESVAIKKSTPLSHIQYLISHSPEDSIIVLCFHSVLPESKEKTNWWYGYKDFCRLCKWLNEQQKNSVVTKRLIDLVEEANNDNN